MGTRGRITVKIRHLLNMLILGSLLLPVAWSQDVEQPAEGESAPASAPAAEEPAPPPEQPEEYVEPEPEPEPPPPAPPPVRQIPSRTGIRPGVAPARRGFQPPAPSAKTSPRSTDPLPKNGATPTEPGSFDFVEVPLSQVVEAIARMTGKNFEYDPQALSAPVTLITYDKIPPELAYEVLESVLYSRGFTMIETLGGHLIKIVGTGQAPADLKEKIELRKGTGGVPETYDTLSTHVIAVKHATAETIASLMQSLGSAVASVIAYPPTNTLIITDTADGLRRMFALLEDIDVAGYDTETEIFMIEYSRAEVLAQQLNEVLMGTGAEPTAPRTARPPTPQRPMPPQRLSTSRALPGQGGSSVVGSREEVLRIVPDERLNALIVIATPTLMERARELIGKLDTPTPYEANNMNVYKLLNADAEKVEEALNTFLGATPRTATDRPAAQTGEIQPFEKKVVVARYEQTNALLILASPQDYKVIREIIAQLDVPQRQVMVEAVIMDVSIQDTFGLAVDVASVTGNDAFALANTSNISQLANATELATELSSGTAALGTALRLLNMGSTGGITAGIFDTIEATVNGVKVKIPFVPFLIKALQTVTDVDILSQPSLTTQDKEPADIVVGQELPVPMQRSGYSYDPRQGTNQQQQQYPSYGMTSYGRGISREEIGVKMKVTPQINEGDYVSLETEIEVSEPTTSTIGIDPNELGPTFNKSRITNNVVVKDGTTGIIGGLIKETTSHTKNQTPILGSLPGLGWLFRNKSNLRRKQNVVVLITPYIIKDGSDLERISKYKMEEFKSANVDVLFEKGIIKKIRKGSKMRNKYRPSLDRTDTMLQSEGFGRGDIPR